MAVLEIYKIPDPVLRQKAEPVERVTKKLAKLTKDMLETMYEADGVGLAAPQIGLSKRIIVLDAGKGPLTLFNPEIQEKAGAATDVEGCLSIPGVSKYVPRAADVVVTGLDERGREVRIKADGFLARVLQHEIDHLDGILFTDRSGGKRKDGDKEEPVQE